MVLKSTHNLCFEQEYEKVSEILSENFPFLVVKFSIYLNRRVFVMNLYHSLGRFSRLQIGDNYLIFPRKQDLTFHENCFHWKQFV